MTTFCPSCSCPLSDMNTPRNSGETLQSGDVIVCQSCGFVISNQPIAETGDVGEVDALARQASSVQVSNRRIAHFRTLRLIGKGGFGAVWLAEDLNLGRQVALKLPKSDAKDAKLLHEAKTAAQLKHPNIVSIYEVGTAGDQIYIASEYIEGQSLRETMDQQRLPIDRVVELVVVVSRAVDHAHANDIIHRDLKPANIILDAHGQPHVTDFGIAKHVDENETISTDGQIIGTVAYMSPEQARGNTRETDSRSDVYAIGTMLFELLTEFRPFRGSARGILHQKLNEDPPSPRKLVPLIPRDLETICLKCLEREPGKRYQSATAIADELQRYQQGMPIQARPVSRLEKTIRWCKRNQTVCLLLAVVFCSLLTGLVSTSYFWLRSERNFRQRQQTLYRTHMMLASNLWSRGDINGLRSTLGNYASGAADSGQRGFEWYYFDKSLAPFLQIVDHGEAVVDVSVSRTGSLFASAGRDRVIRVWDAESGELVRTLRPRAGRVGMIEFSSNSERLLSTHDDGRVRVWNPRQHDNEAVSLLHGSQLVAARFGRSGKAVISIDAAGTVVWWDLASKQETRRVDSLGKSVRDLAMSADGSRLAVACLDGTIIILDSLSGQRLHQVDTRTRIQRVAFAADNQSLLAGGGSDRIANVWIGDETRVEIAGFDAEAVGDVDYLRQLDRSAAVLANNYLVLLDADRMPTRILPTHSLTHGVLSQSADGRFLAVGSGDGTVKLLLVASLGEPQVLMHDKHVRGVAFVDSDRVITAVGDGSVHAWNIESGDHQELVRVSGREMLSVAVHPDGERVFTAGMIPEIFVLNLNDSAKQASISLPLSGVGSLDVSPNGRMLAAGSRSGLVLVYALADTAEPIIRINKPDTQVAQLRFSPDGQTLAVAYSTKEVVILQLADSQTRRAWTFDTVPQAITYSGDGSLLVVGTQGGKLHFVDLTAGTAHAVHAHQGRISAIEFLPDGKRLVSAGRDKKLNLWDVPSRSRVAVLSGHQRQVFAIDVSADGQTIASGGLDGDLRLWRIGGTEPLDSSTD